MDGKVVRLTRGDFTASKIYSDKPVEIALQWQEKGAERLHIVDLDGANTGECRNLDVVREIVKKINLPVQFGGGIRDLDTVKKIFDAGVKWAILGTSAVVDEQFLKNAVSSFPDRIIVSVDIRDNKICIKGWKENTSEDVSAFFSGMRTGRIASFIITDIKKDGTLEGVDTDFFEGICKKSPFPIIVAGGVSSLEDIRKLSSVDKVEGAIIGKALYAGAINLEEAVKISSKVKM